MDLSVLSLLLLSLLTGIILGWTAVRAGSQRQLDETVAAHRVALAAQQSLASETGKHLGGVQEDLRRTRHGFEAERLATGHLREENAQLRTEVAHQRAVLPEKLALLANAQEQLKTAFDALAANALRLSTGEFLKLADQKLASTHNDSLGEMAKRQHALDELIKPIRDTLAQVDQKLGETEMNRLQTSTTLETMLREVGQQHERLRGETHNLVRALRSPTVRGRWGEVQLRRVIEMAGLVERCDFEEQPTLTADGVRLRPDLIVRLPGGRTVVVDAKVPLEAYLTAIEATDDDARRARLADHARQVRAHVDKLAAKSYWEQLDASPEFVIMFLGAEAIYHAALQEDPALVESAARRKVLLAGPMNLIGLLLVVAQGWRHERMAQNAEEICALGKELYSRIVTMTSNLDDLRKKLDGSVQAYNKVIGSFEGRVLVQARKLRDLGAATGDEIAPLDAIDTAPRVLQSANLLGLPEEATIDAETLEATLVEQERVG